jgi:hypothetical protein
VTRRRIKPGKISEREKLDPVPHFFWVHHRSNYLEVANRLANRDGLPVTASTSRLTP